MSSSLSALRQADLRGLRFKTQLLQRNGFLSALVRASLAHVVANRIPLCTQRPLSEAFMYCLRNHLLPRTLGAAGVKFLVSAVAPVAAPTARTQRAGNQAGSSKAAKGKGWRPLQTGVEVRPTSADSDSDRDSRNRESSGSKAFREGRPGIGSKARPCARNDAASLCKPLTRRRSTSMRSKQQHRHSPLPPKHGASRAASAPPRPQSRTESRSAPGSRIEASTATATRGCSIGTGAAGLKAPRTASLSGFSLSGLDPSARETKKGSSAGNRDDGVHEQDPVADLVADRGWIQKQDLGADLAQDLQAGAFVQFANFVV
jgi:hypothetical protein